MNARDMTSRVREPPSRHWITPRGDGVTKAPRLAEEVDRLIMHRPEDRLARIGEDVLGLNRQLSHRQI